MRSSSQSLIAVHVFSSSSFHLLLFVSINSTISAVIPTNQICYWFGKKRAKAAFPVSLFYQLKQLFQGVCSISSSCHPHPFPLKVQTGPSNPGCERSVKSPVIINYCCFVWAGHPDPLHYKKPHKTPKTQFPSPVSLLTISLMTQKHLSYRYRH